MLEGLEVSEVRLTEVVREEIGGRFDAEYFQKEYLHEDSNLSKIGTDKLGNHAFITDGQHGYYESDINSNIFMLAARNCKNYFANKIDALPLAKWVDDKNKRSSLHCGDIILSTRGSVGCCAIVYNEVLPANINQDVARINLNNSNVFSPEFLITYLNCKYGQNWMVRNQSGMVQQGLPLDKVRAIPLPLLSSEFQKIIKTIIQKSYRKLVNSSCHYQEAENILLSELLLKSFKPRNEIVSIKCFSDFASSGRLDAEYYQCKYDDIEEKIRSVSYKTIADLKTFNARGVQPDYISDGNIAVVNSKHILEDGLDYDNFEHTTEVFFSLNERGQIGYGDILIYTTGANIGRTQVYLKHNLAMASNHVNILRVKDVNPIYLALVLNSLIGRMQTEKFCTGSAQTEIYPNDIEKFIVPILNETIQETIAEKVQECFAMKRESKQLLNIAKKAVEIAISENEGKALAYIKVHNLSDTL